jgi:hypothetical protein
VRERKASRIQGTAAQTSPATPHDPTPQQQEEVVPRAVLELLDHVFGYAISIGVPQYIAWEMAGAGQHVLLGGQPRFALQPAPMLSTPVRPTPFGFIFAAELEGDMPAELEGDWPQREIYELADTSIPSPERHRVIADAIMSSPTPLRHYQTVEQLERQSSEEPSGRLEGPPVLEPWSPLVVSSTGPNQSRLVTTPPPHTGANELPTIPEDPETDFGQTGFSNFAKDGNAFDDGEDAMEVDEW